MHTFEEKIWVWFGPIDGDDFDEALSKKFGIMARFGNINENSSGCKTRSMDGLKRHWLACTSDDAIMFARMRDEHVHRQ